MHPANDDPNKLLYNPVSGYDQFTQEVLALVRFTNDPPNVDGVRGGVSSVSNLGDGQGINLLFRQPGQNGTDNHFNLLNDQVAWGPSTDGFGTGNWTQNDYKWLRLRYSLNEDGFNDAFGKLWDAGTEPEPVDYNLSLDQEGRTGLAGLATVSIGGMGEFEVDYVLIKADGLPTIQVVPEPTAALGFAFGALSLGLRRRRA
ncbi:MAG: PEP-CTERM sorting domain-containing protein [Chthoniobacteraceae bacterium]